MNTQKFSKQIHKLLADKKQNSVHHGYRLLIVGSDTILIAIVCSKLERK